ncbi:hypothetical protein BDL97_19G006200 [Sphagnum fallax]|nr:hypothetical protein BDL97_19G006200 [Sphagnum fallax]
MLVRFCRVTFSVCDTFAIPLRCDSHAYEILSSHLLCLRYLCDTFAMRFTCLYKRKITAAEMNMGQEHGKEHLFAHVDALLAFEGESESSQGSSDEEERAASTTAPSATTSSGPSSFASRNECSARGKDKEDREEDEDEDKGQGDDEEREEDEQPPPPPENTRKKDSRKKSKRGRKSR